MSTETLQILLIEDNETHVDLIHRALMPEGKKFNLTVADSLAGARKMLKESSPGLMLVDYKLPDGGGIELLPGDPDTLTFPIVMLTGHRDEKVATAAMKAGAIDYIVKSDRTLAEIPHLIERILREWEHITERKRVEGALAKSEIKYRTLVDSVAALPWAYDVTNDRFTFLGDQIRTILGIPPDTLSKLKDWMKLIHPDDRKRTVNFSIAKMTEETHYEIEHRMKLADGSWAWVRNVISVEMGQNGPVGLSGFMFDITKVKQVEQTLLKERQQTRQIIDTARDAFARMDANGIITDWNPGAEKMFGWSRNEAVGKKPAETFVPKKFRKAHTKGLEHYLASGEGPILNKHVETIAQRRDGHTFPVELSIVPVRSNDDVSFNAFIRDISARQQAQEALRKSHERLRASLIGTIVAISRAVGARDPYTAGHQQRVARLACCIAQEMILNAQQIDGLRMGATIHDIGKIQLPAEILSKPSKLTETEFELIKSHCQVGYDILKDISFPWPVADIAHQHHERIDGTGYPQCLKGDEICLEARIVAVADVVEAMSSHRPYRPALGIDAALEEIETHRGQWFEPAVVDACLKLFREKGFSFES